VILRLNSVAGFAEPALSLIGHTPNGPQTLPRGFTHQPSFGIKQADIVKQKQRTRRWQVTRCPAARYQLAICK